MLRLKNCNCERVFASSAKLQLTLPVRGFERRMRIQNVALKIHFPVPTCLCKQGTKNVLNTHFLRKAQGETGESRRELACDRFLTTPLRFLLLSALVRDHSIIDSLHFNSDVFM